MLTWHICHQKNMLLWTMSNLWYPAKESIWAGHAALDCRCQHRDLWNRSMKSAAPCCACFSSSASYSSCNCKSSSFTSWRRRQTVCQSWGYHGVPVKCIMLKPYFNQIKHHQTIENPQIFMVKPLQSRKSTGPHFFRSCFRRSASCSSSNLR